MDEVHQSAVEHGEKVEFDPADMDYEGTQAEAIDLSGNYWWISKRLVKKLSRIILRKMAKIDPIIAVKDVEASSKWYQSVFGCRRTHGGDDFAVLVSENDDVLICLHKWGEHEHPTMTNPIVTTGNGLILYFRTENMNEIRQNVEKTGCSIEEDIHLNPNSRKMEFSLRDPDGYYLTIAEFHKYEGSIE